MRTQWEYNTLRFDLTGTLTRQLDARAFDVALGRLGAEGWELVSVLELNNQMVAVFKRPRAG